MNIHFVLHPLVYFSLLFSCVSILASYILSTDKLAYYPEARLKPISNTIFRRCAKKVLRSDMSLVLN
jgi:hypothetical protein